MSSQRHPSESNPFHVFGLASWTPRSDAAHNPTMVPDVPPSLKPHYPSLTTYHFGTWWPPVAEIKTAGCRYLWVYCDPTTCPRQVGGPSWATWLLRASSTFCMSSRVRSLRRSPPQNSCFSWVPCRMQCAPTGGERNDDMVAAQRVGRSYRVLDELHRATLQRPELVVVCKFE